MAGYTPTFDSIYDGTLYGRWPAAAVWGSILPLADKRGEINRSYESLAGMIGWPMELLRLGIAQLMEPDPGSRTRAEDGRRLVLLDPDRPWGWRVVNHAIYRERARLMAKNEREVSSGENAERLSTAAHRRSPPLTAAHPLSDSNSEANKKNPPTPLTGGSPRKRTSESREASEFHRSIIAAYHESLPNLPAVKIWTRKREQSLEARIRERVAAGKPADTADYWRKLFAEVARSDFLCGRGDTEFRADLEWLLRPENFAKVIEGRYAPRGNGRAR